MFRKRTLVSVSLLTSTVWLGSVLPAHSLPESEPAQPGDFCTAAELESGVCLTSVVSGNTSPMQAAVIQAIARGERSKAQRFVAARGASHRDSEQKALERILAETSTAVEPIAAPGQGTVVGGTHYLTDYPTYLYCNSSGCTQVGKIKAQFRMTITFYPDNTLSGDLDVTQGPSVDFTYLECLSRLDRNNLPDTTVFTWSNCPDAHNRDTYTFHAPIQAKNWRQGGTRGEKYYNRYRLKFKTSAGSRPEFGPFEWATHRWYIPLAGGKPYWLT